MGAISIKTAEKQTHAHTHTHILSHPPRQIRVCVEHTLIMLLVHLARTAPMDPVETAPPPRRTLRYRNMTRTQHAPKCSKESRRRHLPPCHHVPTCCNGSAHFVALPLRFSCPFKRLPISSAGNFSTPFLPLSLTLYRLSWGKVCWFVDSTCNLFDYLRLVFNLFGMFCYKFTFCLSHSSFDL